MPKVGRYGDRAPGRFRGGPLVRQCPSPQHRDGILYEGLRAGGNGVALPCILPVYYNTTFYKTFGQVGERTARGEDGKTYYVPAGMTYGEWKETFVGGGDKPGLDGYTQNGVTYWTKKVDKIDPMNDITQEWTRTKGTKGTVTERQGYMVDGTIYKVDGKQTILL